MTFDYHIASVSFGKDSLAMLLMLIEKQYPLDEVMFYDTGMEFNAIYNLEKRLQPLLQEHGIQYVRLTPENPFLYDMLERPVCSKQKGTHSGYGWCGGLCRWGTSNKVKTLDNYAKKKNAMIYVGIAVDETERVERINKCDYKSAPLAEWNITEAQALQYCYDHGYNWDENGQELYNLLDRVSCWCCGNKNKKELRNMREYLPQYWEKLLNLQSKLERPMKKFKTDAHFGDLGNILNLEKYWQAEDEMSLF